MKRINSVLWKKTLGLNNSDYSEQIELLRLSFEDSRNNASYILNKISKDFPELTIHDITHADSLWQVSSVIIGRDYDINPLEGYILGCAFLMHDAGLSYYAAGGVKKLRETIEWKDFYSDYEHNTKLSENDKLYQTDFKAIRSLHAKYAESLYNQLFKKEDDSSFYIINNKSLRDHLGPLIGKISASHHWSIDKVVKLGTQEPAPSDFPQEWRINPLKLACILRCADAGHIDSGRAPDYLYNLLSLHGISYNHWTSQNRLSQIDTDKNDSCKVIIKSNIAFKKEDFSSWNVAYEAIKIFDKELKDSNRALRKNSVEEFQAKEVCGYESKEELCKYIQTDGWMPCDADVHISNVESLIKNLGGENLYGSEHKLEIVLRELIQNSRDAIIARKKYENDLVGKIRISVEKIKNKLRFSITDNGVGMSLDTIKNYLLNFGCSFWYSDLSKKEYPGLASSGYKSVGKFGIGFFSVFMVSSEVKIETRKYDNGLDSALSAEFPFGLTLCPIISHSHCSNSNISTVISFSIDENKCKWLNTVEMKPHYNGEESFFVPYYSVLSNLAAGLDVDVYYKELQSPERCVHSNIESLEIESEEIKNWLIDISFARFRSNKLVLDYICDNFKRLRKILYKQEVIGIAAINTFWCKGYTSFLSIHSVGGLSSLYYGSDSDFIGFINGEPLTARRNSKITSVSKNMWVKEQYEILKSQGIKPIDGLYLPYFLGKYHIDFISDIYLCCYNKKEECFLKNIKELLRFLWEHSCRLILPLSDLKEKRIEHYLDVKQSIEKIKENDILFVSIDNSDFLSLEDKKDSFPYTLFNCLKIIAQDNSLEIICNEEKNLAVSSIFGRKCSAFVITIKPVFCSNRGKK